MAVTGSQSSASPATLIALVVVLAGLDLVGALLAKEWTSGRSPWMFAGGALVFLLLFSVYAIGLRFAEMSTVTFGWIVGLQVAVLFLERVRYGVSPVSYTHLRAHETVLELVCRLLLEKKNNYK